jgi:hypothetical protein
MSRQIADDPMAQFFPLEAYQFLGKSAQVVLTGYYIGPSANGQQFPQYTDAAGVTHLAGIESWRKGGGLFTITVPVQNGTNTPVGFEAAVVNAVTIGIPQDATGAILTTPGDTLFDVGGVASARRAEFIAGAAGLWPTGFGAADGTILFGRVHWGSK